MIEIKENAVYRDGQQIAVIEGSKCLSHSEIAPVIRGQIRKAAKAELSFALITQLDEEHENNENSPPVTSTSDEIIQEVETATIIEPSPIRTITQAIEAADAGIVAKYPPMHEALGSRTPQFVSWIKTVLSADDFAAEYSDKILPTVEEVEFQFGKAARLNAAAEKASESEHGGEKF